MEKYRIYCSGTLFCAEEVGGMNAIARVLEDAGFQTFLPPWHYPQNTAQ